MTPARRDTIRGANDGWFAVPLIGWMLLFLAVPLFLVILLAFLQRNPYGGVEWSLTLKNFFRAMDWLYLRIMLKTVIFASTTALLCLFLGFPVAWILTRSTPVIRFGLMGLILIPFFTNLVVRALGTKILFSATGPLAHLFSACGWEWNPYGSFWTHWMLFMGMVSNYLPFMVVPLFVSLEKFDFTLVEAGQNLGASPLQCFFKIVLPMQIKSLVSGFFLVFIPALGEFVIPDLLAGGKTMFLGNLVADQFFKARDWPFGACLVNILLCAGLILYFLADRRAPGSPTSNPTSEGTP